MAARPAAVEQSADAKTRLLQAALELFGNRGFSETSVRELSVAAGVNVAAVSYHFGSKDHLRIEALRYGFAPIIPVIGALQGIRDEARKSGTTVAAEAALRRFIAVFLKEAVGRKGKHWAMFMRERMSPGPALEMVMREFFAPIGGALTGILELLLPGAAQEELHFCLASIIGQCVHIKNSEPMLRFFTGKDAGSRKYLDGAAAHIAEFSIQALRGIRRGAAKRGI